MSLQDQIQSVAQKADMKIGFALEHIESGEKIQVNGAELFPMASVFKIPILATAIKQMAKDKFKLADRIELDDADKSFGSGILPYFEAGLKPTVLDLMTLMIIISDNTATDMMIDLVGGPEVVEKQMHDLGLDDIFFKMNVKNLLKTLLPVEIRDKALPEILEWLKNPENDIVRDSEALSQDDDNNVSSAASMTTLCAMIFRGEIGDEAATETMLDILHKQQFNVRLSRFYPRGTLFAHKTGTIGGIRNDAGILTLGDDNHVALTLFTLWDDAAVADQPEAEHDRVFEVETAMGRIGKLVYDHYSQ